MERNYTYDLFHIVRLEDASWDNKGRNYLWFICACADYNSVKVAAEFKKTHDVCLVRGGFANFQLDYSVQQQVAHHIENGGVLVSAKQDVGDMVKIILHKNFPDSHNYLDRIYQLNSNGKVSRSEKEEIISLLSS